MGFISHITDLSILECKNLRNVDTFCLIQGYINDTFGMVFNYKSKQNERIHEKNIKSTSLPK